MYIAEFFDKDFLILLNSSTGFIVQENTPQNYL